MTNDEISENKWTSRDEMLAAWESANTELAAPYYATVQNLMQMGHDAPDNRKDLWASVSAVLRCLGDNSPIRRGRQPDIPQDVLAAIEAVTGPIMEAYLTLFTAPHFGELTLMRGGYAFYDSAEDFANNQIDTLKDNLIKRYRNHVNEKGTDTTKPSWTGQTGKGGKVTIVAGVKPVTDSTEESG